jgi:RimJ/RimL family protein N-acetyltransferase
MPFTMLHAPTVAGWVESEEELHWLAPSTAPPLTAAKVAGWLQPGRNAALLMQEGDHTPVGYAELNPMRRDPSHLWIGHIVIRPDKRGEGLGKSLVEQLLAEAFERQKASRVSLIVFPQNTAAVECYKRVGFTLIGDEYHQFRDGPCERMLRFEILPSDRPRQ